MFPMCDVISSPERKGLALWNEIEYLHTAYCMLHTRYCTLDTVLKYMCFYILFKKKILGNIQYL